MKKAMDERNFIFEVLDSFLVIHKPNDMKIITGDAKGADTAGLEWANSRGVYSSAYPADWKKYGYSAGPIRNKLMLDKELVEVDTDTGKWKNFIVLAFPGGNGTKDMIKQSKKAGVEVIEYEYK